MQSNMLSNTNTRFVAYEYMVQSQFLNESMMQNTRLDQQPALTIKGNYNVKESLVAMDRL
jgi:hypothetical protein